MGLVRNMTRHLMAELRSSLENPQVPLSYPAEWLLDIFNGGRTDAGIRVSEMTALQVSTVLACVNIISNGIASLPLQVMSKAFTDKRLKRTVAYTHPLFDILYNQPNPEMTSPTFRKTLQCHALLWGNCYAEIERNGANQVVALWPRNPSRTRPVRLTQEVTVEGTKYPNGTMMYETYETIGDSQIMEDDNPGNKYGARRIVLSEDMIHIPGLSLDGRMGQDTIQFARQAIGLALATEKYGAKFFGNGAIPQGLLISPGDLTDVQLETMKRSWMEQHGGENAHRTGVLPPGVKYEKIGSSPSEGQMLEIRQYQRAEISSIFGVPGHMVGNIEKSTGRATVEQTSMEFVLYCLNPWLQAWEHELQRKLFNKKKGAKAGEGFHARFDTRQLLYPDADARSKFYASGKNWGFLNSNDIREWENLNPIEDGSGDIYYMPTNMQDAALITAVSQAAQDHLDNGELGVVPPNTKPVGNHPVAKDEKAKAKMVAKTRADALANQPTPPAGKGPAGKPTGKRSEGRPYDSVADVPDYVPASKKAQWMHVWNSAYKKAKDSGKSSDDAETLAFKEANGVANREALEPVFSGMFTDAIGRAMNRKKAEEADFTKIFGPLLFALTEATETAYDPDVIKKYVAGVFQRSQKWNADTTKEAAGRYEFRAAFESVCGEGPLHNLVPTKKMYIARHGKTAFNAGDDRYREWTDVELTPEGAATVRASAQALKGLGIKRIVSCDLKRAVQTAAIYAQELCVPIQWEERLRTWHHGFGGATKAEAGDKVKFYAEHPWETPPNGECLAEFRRRTLDVMGQLRFENESTGPILVITSGSNISCWRNFLESSSGWF